MELSKNIISGISLANSETISDSDYKLILTDVFKTAVSKPSEFNVIGSEQKIVYSSLLSLVLEAAKNDCHLSTLSSLLEECQIKAERITVFINMYQENKEQIQLHLSLIGRSYDQVIDVDWRQDYVVKSSNCEKICEPSYIISMKTWNTQKGAENNVTFGCTLEQLQDLVLKLKDATKCIERTAT